VQIFENKGEVMGASNPHPHGQVWALDALPNEPAKEEERQKAYFAEHGRPLLVDYAGLELERAERLVVSNQDWLALVPYWAVWPFEALLLPRRPVLRLPDLAGDERWAGMAPHWTATITPTGSYTPISTRPCCAQPPSRNSWWATRCSASRSATSPRSRRQKGYVVSRKYTTRCNANKEHL
jgi:galactose-1-phosphate uridylyltransferase